MFWIVVLFVALVGLALWYSAPEGVVVHAARSKDVWIRHRRFPLLGLYRDSRGNPIDLEGRMLALVKGDSCVEYGVRDGDVVIARKLDEDGRAAVNGEDLVIINSALSDDSRPLRFRRIRQVRGGLVDFYDDPTGPLLSKPLDDVLARVEMVGAY